MENGLLSNQSLSDKEYQTISSYIEANVGIKLPETKRIMIQSRLIPRLRHLNFSSFGEYINYVFSSKDGNQELIFMINALTTNKTDFFFNRNGDGFCVVVASKNGAKFYATVNRNDKICRRFQK
jgi:hypothetical protein